MTEYKGRNLMPPGVACRTCSRFRGRMGVEVTCVQEPSKSNPTNKITTRIVFNPLAPGGATVIGRTKCPADKLKN